MRKELLLKVKTILMLAFMISLIGCAGISENSNSEGGKNFESGNQALKVAFDQGIDSLNPYGDANGEPSTILASRQIYDTLVVNEEEEIKPSLAESWEQPDSKTWTFNIKEGVTFHDGSSLTAEDVKYSIEQQVDSDDSPLTVLWSDFDSVEVKDDYTIEIKTKKPMGTLLSSLTLLFITPADSATDEFYKEPIGSGPFKVSSFVPEQELKLTDNEEYWDGSPKLKKLEFENIPETSSRLTALETGEIDLTWTIP